jgi:hypothetical protein
MRRIDPVSRQASLWFGLLAGPAGWTLHELVSYALVRVACANNLGLLLHVVTLGSLAIATAGTYVAFRAYRTQRREDARFLAGAGVLVSGLFTFTIVMEGIPNVVVSPCL